MLKRGLAILSTCFVFASANDVTINATMGLMDKGLNEVQSGMMYNNIDQVKNGITILESANKIFNGVNVETFIPNNHRVGVTKNILKNFNRDLNSLKNSINKKNLFEASKKYSQVMIDCMSCHKIIRGW